MKKYLIIEVHRMYDPNEYRARIFDHNYDNVTEFDFCARNKKEIEEFLYNEFKAMFGNNYIRRRIYEHSIRDHLWIEPIYPWHKY